MKTLLLVLVLLGSVAQADKVSEKEILDGCFKEVLAINKQAGELQAHNGEDAELPALQAKLHEKSNRCFGLKKTYEKSYGKYTVPRQ